MCKASLDQPVSIDLDIYVYKPNRCGLLQKVKQNHLQE